MTFRERELLARTSPPGEANVGKNSYWLQDCPKHGTQAHLSYLGGACEKCQAERLGAVRPDSHLQNRVP